MYSSEGRGLSGRPRPVAGVPPWTPWGPPLEGVTRRVKCEPRRCCAATHQHAGCRWTPPPTAPRQLRPRSDDPLAIELHVRAVAAFVHTASTVYQGQRTRRLSLPWLAVRSCLGNAHDSSQAYRSFTTGVGLAAAWAPVDAPLEVRPHDAHGPLVSAGPRQDGGGYKGARIIERVGV